MKKTRKNSVHPAKSMVDIIRNPRSSAYKELCEMCTDENDIQSDAAAATVRSELESDLKRLLSGDFDVVTDKIARHAETPPRIKIESQKSVIREDHYTNTKIIRLGNRNVYVSTVRSVGATVHQTIYGSFLRRLLESGDIARVALCRVCQKIFYRKSLKGEFCSSTCRWRNSNQGEQRKEKRRKGGEWQWWPGKGVAGRPRKMAHQSRISGK